MRAGYGQHNLPQLPRRLYRIVRVSPGSKGHVWSCSCQAITLTSWHKISFSFRRCISWAYEWEGWEHQRTVNSISMSMKEAMIVQKRLKKVIQTSQFCLKQQWQDVENRRQVIQKKSLTSYRKPKQRLVCMPHNPEQHDVKKESSSDL